MTERGDELEGGESACFAHLICPDCGVVLDGADHLWSCTWVDQNLGVPTKGVEQQP